MAFSRDACVVVGACSLVRIHFGSNHDFTPGIHSKSSQLFELALSSGNHAAWRPARLPFRARGRTMGATAPRSNSTSPVGGTPDGVADTICRGLPASAQAPDKADAAAARKEGNLSWYTSTPVALAQQLADKFQEQNGIKVQLLRTGGQAVLRRLQQEVSAGRPGADVM